MSQNRANSARKPSDPAPRRAQPTQHRSDRTNPQARLGGHTNSPRPQTSRQTPAQPAEQNATSRPRQNTGSRITVEKMLVWYGFVVAAILTLSFGLDLVIGAPFLHASPLMDVTFVGCGLVLGYMCWDVYRNLK